MKYGKNWEGLSDADETFWDNFVSPRVVERDGGKCTICKSTNRLTAHHTVIRKDPLDCYFNELVTLCMSCHRKLHTGKIDLKGKKLK